MSGRPVVSRLTFGRGGGGLREGRRTDHDVGELRVGHRWGKKRKARSTARSESVESLPSRSGRMGTKRRTGISEGSRRWRFQAGGRGRAEGATFSCPSCARARRRPACSSGSMQVAEGPKDMQGGRDGDGQRIRPRRGRRASIEVHGSRARGETPGGGGGGRD